MLPVGAILLIGGWAHAAGAVQLGTVVAVVLHAQSLSAPLDELFTWLEELQVGGTALQRVLGVSQVPLDAPREASGPARERDVVLRDVRCSSRPGQEVLHGIDLVVPAGQRWAIVGAGKSTQGTLVAGVVRPDSSSVSVGGCEVSAMPTEALRREVVLLPQEQHVFASSLRDNLALPDRDTRDEELRAVLKASACRSGCAGSPTAWTPGSAPAVSRCPRHARSSWRWPGCCAPIRTPWSSTRRPRCWTARRRGTWSTRGHAAGRPHGHRHRAPAAHRARSRPARGDVRGARRGAGGSRRADGGGRVLRAAAPGGARRHRGER
ncbi:ATP-binding cassette domain-containing protein [Saccharopolyspora rhizosphaerae]|uniref:ATP-binding cassette domain-containing protein n=1 Tax=Saccharopolyspora rhizosphaerae TaxID=2492662 RepID=UPI001F3805AE|nr:ABC transporter ATP-binding protein [Saccharopolyspora rhizosphaerae]